MSAKYRRAFTTTVANCCRKKPHRFPQLLTNQIQENQKFRSHRNFSIPVPSETATVAEHCKQRWSPETQTREGRTTWLADISASVRHKVFQRVGKGGKLHVFYSINSTLPLPDGTLVKNRWSKMTRYDDTSFYPFSQQSTVSFVVSQVTEEQRLMQIDLCKIGPSSHKIKESPDKIQESSDKIDLSKELRNANEIEDKLRSTKKNRDYDCEAVKLRNESELNELKEDSESQNFGDLNSNCVSAETRAESVV